MTLIEKQALAASYANAWRAVKGGAGRLMRVDVEPHGWFTIHYGYPAHSSRVRAEKLLLGLEVLTRRLFNGDGHVIETAVHHARSTNTVN
jgi:hypothetical protein